MSLTFLLPATHRIAARVAAILLMITGNLCGPFGEASDTPNHCPPGHVFRMGSSDFITQYSVDDLAHWGLPEVIGEKAPFNVSGPSPFDQFGNNVLFMPSPDAHEKRNGLIVKVFRSNSDSVVFVDVLGRLSAYSIEANEGDSNVYLTPRALPDDRVLGIKPVQNPPRNFRMPGNINKQRELATSMALAQLQGSNTWRDQAARWPEMLPAQIEVNLELLKLLKSRKAITIEHLQSWHKRINSSSSEGINYSLSGAILGTKIETVHNGQAMWFDLGRSTEVAIPYSEGHYLNLGSPEQVPLKLVRNIARLNNIRSQSNIIEIVRVYRDFILIHPFTDSNGRLGRVLLSGALIMAGYSPMTKSVSSLDVLFQTDHDLARAIITNL